ncbi:MAG: hypothetical protein K9H61_03380 [Bacteroidia bacterium]|nr:hypothetical protein [Bacteroidia bacterium]MCF8446014.1 hypothetical protein [Bacteroidia bacterium]
MKKNNITSIYSLLALFLTFSLVNSCKIKNPIEGVGITIKASAVGAPNIFRVINANTGYSDPQFENAIVKISGDDADIIYTADGSKTIKIVEGQFGLSVRSGIKASSDNPIKFNILVSIPGYLDLYMPFEITNETPITTTLSLINLTTPPPSVSSKDTFANVSAGGELMDTLKFTTPIPANGDANAEITINPGTKFFDENGNPFVGKVNAKAVFIEPKTEDELYTFPGNKSGMLIYDSSLNNPNMYILNPYAWVTLEFSNNGKVFKKPPSFGVSGVSISISSPGSNTWHPGVSSGSSGGAGGSDIITNPFAFTSAGFGGGSGIRMPNRSSRAKVELVTTQKVSLSLGQNKEEFSNYEFYTILRNKADQKVLGQTKINFTTAETVLSVDAPSSTISTSELIIEMTNKSTKVKTTQIVNSSTGTSIKINLPAPPAKEYYFIIRFAVTCPDKKRIILDEGHTVYLIPENDYENTLRVVDGRRIFPQDKAINGVKWDQYIVGPEFEENGKRYSTLKIPIGAVKTNTTYRASTIYGNKGRVDNDQNQPLVTPPVFPPNQDYIMELDMEAKSCD